MRIALERLEAHRLEAHRLGAKNIMLFLRREFFRLREACLPGRAGVFASPLLAALLLAALPATQALASSCRDSILSGEGVFQKMRESGDHYVQLSLKKPSRIGEEAEKEAMALRPFPQKNSRSVYIEKQSEMRHSTGFHAERISRTVQEERVSWRLEPVEEYDSLSVFEALSRFGHETLHFILYEPAGLQAIIATHNSVLGHGASIGGTRVQDYASEADGLMDVLRLSEGMSYKAAAADIPAGGGKAVIFASPETGKSISLLRSYGEYLSVLNGLNQHKAPQGRPYFATGEDMGLTQKDLILIGQTGGSYLLGFLKLKEPAILTAEGVLAGIRAAALRALGKTSLEGLSAFVQGAGNVGGRVAEKLVQEGLNVSVYDTDRKKLQALSEKTGARITDWRQALSEGQDIFVPCAMGGIVNAETVRIFKCKIIAGSANNQLEEPKYGDDLQERGILYAPDYVINAGGLISVSRDMASLNEGREPAAWAMEKTQGIYSALMNIFQTAEARGISPAEAADQLARQKIRKAQSEMEARRRGGSGFVSNTMWPRNRKPSQTPSK